MMALFLWPFLALLSHGIAREITFPPVAAVQLPLAGMAAGDESPNLDISMMMSGIQTYANLPYVHCLANDGEDVEPYDIAMLGAPFDTVRRFTLRCTFGRMTDV